MSAPYRCYNPRCTAAFTTQIGLGMHKRRCDQKLTSICHELSHVEKRRRLENTSLSIDTFPSNTGDIEDAPSMAQPLPEISQQDSYMLQPTRSGQRRRMPLRYRDEQPPLPPCIPQATVSEIKSADNSTSIPVDPTTSNCATTTDLSFVTSKNNYGIYRIFLNGRPSIFPETQEAAELYQSPNFDIMNTTDKRPWWAVFRPSAKAVTDDLFVPFKNAACYFLTLWANTGQNSKSIPEMNRLAKYLCDARFNTDDLHDYEAGRETKQLDNYVDFQVIHSSSSESESSLFVSRDGWVQSSVSIPLPYEKLRQSSESEAPRFEVDKVLYCRPLEIINSALNEGSSDAFHWFPFKEYWKPSDDMPPERIYSELYSADAFLDEHAQLTADQAMIGPAPWLESVIVAIMVWSDSTHLSSFGNSSLWPIYLFIGNQSKYVHCKTNLFAAHHLAYIPKLSDKFQDFYKLIFGLPATADVITQCKREIIHLIWLLILDDDFMHAYVHGFTHRFVDGIARLVFPRFFTYAADYPEKVLLACIKFLADCPCPRCGVLKAKIPDMGKKFDMTNRIKNMRIDNDIIHQKIARARDFAFTKGIPIGSTHIAGVLGTESLTPVWSAFSQRLFAYGFNHYRMLVPDLLHEFELGVWKAIFVHLMRILHANGPSSIQNLNARYRLVPPFGRGTIRCFGTNASSMKKLAARDYEDLLQCAIPVFDRLLSSPHDAIVISLLFELATWHALAKLRVHTETTLHSLESSTQRLGQAIRQFNRVTCAAFRTSELPSEQAARGRREAALTAKQQMRPNVQEVHGGPHRRKEKHFNMSTYKLHALGDYANSIRLFGTTDGFTTQVGETQHKLVKKYYSRVSKAHHEIGISKQQRRERILMKITEHCIVAEKNTTSATHNQDTLSRKTSKTSPILAFEDEERLPYTNPELKYHISSETKYKLNVYRWPEDNDPAFENFLPRLYDHLLSRMGDSKYDGEQRSFTNAERSSITIINDLIYRHKVLRVNYTTYNLRRSQDSINPRTCADIMILSQEDREEHQIFHPYWYARVIGIFHTFVTSMRNSDEPPKRMDFLYVRWFGRDLEFNSGWKARRLHRIGFIKSNDPDSFGFLDPSLVVRAVHLIPAFELGQTSEFLPPSIIRPRSDDNMDWSAFYVNIFVDRDMFMRFRGGGVGHKSTRAATNDFLQDRHPLEFDTGNETTGDGEELDNEDFLQDDVLEEAIDYEYGEHEDEEHDADGEPVSIDDDDTLGPEDGEDSIEEGEAELGYDEL